MTILIAFYSRTGNTRKIAELISKGLDCDYEEIIDVIREHTYAISKELRVVGLINIQFAIKNDRVYVLEVNPRASRTIPFISKTTGVPLAKIAAKLMTGISLKDLHFTQEVKTPHVAVKESVLPFSRFSGVDIILGPEMKSTGEVMGIDTLEDLVVAQGIYTKRKRQAKRF